MGQWRRVIHNGVQIIGVEHRADESELGTMAYTDANLLPNHTGMDWFVQDVSVFDDTKGVVPWDALSVGNPLSLPDQRSVLVDVITRDTKRQEEKNRTPGSGGRIDVLEARLADDTITFDQMKELERLERGL